MVETIRYRRPHPPGRRSSHHVVHRRRFTVSPLRFGLPALLDAVAVAAFVVAWEGPGAARIDDGARGNEGQAVAVIVSDGDSLMLGSERIRLEGIDAPELDQTCRDETNREWACERAARERLLALVARGNVACSPRGRDRYNRTLAVCSAEGVPDLGEALVREGLAVNYDRYAGSYRGAEAEARAARRGVWRGGFDRPEDFRRRRSS